MFVGMNPTQISTNTGKTIPGANKMLLVLTLINLFNFLDRYVLSAVLEPIKAELHIKNDGDMGRMATAFMLGYFLTSPIFGYLGDRLSRKKLMAIGVIGWSLGTCLTGIAQGFSFMIFCRVMVGLGEASFGAIGPAVISDAFEAKKRNKAMTIFYLAVPLGAALGFALGGLIAAQLGWRSAFFITGVPGFFLAALLFFVPEPERGQSEEGPVSTEKITVKRLWSLFSNREYLFVNLGYIFYTFAMGAFSFWGPAFLNRVHGLDVADASLFLGPTLVVGGILGTIIGGYFANIWRERSPSGYARLLLISVLCAVPFSFISFLTENTLLSMVFIALSLIFLFQSTGPINTVIVESVAPNVRASAMAICIFMIHAFGDLWSPELVGRVSDQYANKLKIEFNHGFNESKHYNQQGEKELNSVFGKNDVKKIELDSIKDIKGGFEKFYNVQLVDISKTDYYFNKLKSDKRINHIEKVGNLRIGMLILPGAFLLAGLFWFFLVKEQDKKGKLVNESH
jgi:predicted MFS family arabinose efflux permease